MVQMTGQSLSNPIGTPTGLLGQAMAPSLSQQYSSHGGGSHKKKSTSFSLQSKPTQTPEGITRTSQRGQETFRGGKWIVTKAYATTPTQPQPKGNIFQQWIGGVKQTGKQIGSSFGELGRKENYQTWWSNVKQTGKTYTYAAQDFFTFGARLPTYIADKNKRNMDYLQPRKSQEQLNARINLFQPKAQKYSGEVFLANQMGGNILPFERQRLETQGIQLTKEQQILSSDVEKFKAQNKLTAGEVVSGVAFSIATAPISVPVYLSERTITGGFTAFEARKATQQQGYKAGWEKFKPFAIETGVVAATWGAGYGLSKLGGKIFTPKYETLPSGKIVGKNWVGKRLASQEEKFYNLRPAEVMGPYNTELATLGTRVSGTRSIAKSVGGFQIEQTSYIPKESFVGKLIKPVKMWRYSKLNVERTFALSRPEGFGAKTGESIVINKRNLIQTPQGKFGIFTQKGVLDLTEVTGGSRQPTGKLFFGTQGQFVSKGKLLATRGRSWSAIDTGTSVKGNLFSLEGISKSKGSYMESAVRINKPELVLGKRNWQFYSSEEISLYGIQKTSGKQSFGRTSQNLYGVPKLKQSFKSMFSPAEKVTILKTSGRKSSGNIWDIYKTGATQQLQQPSAFPKSVPKLTKGGLKTINVGRALQVPQFGIDVAGLATKTKISPSTGSGFSPRSFSPILVSSSQNRFKESFFFGNISSFKTAPSIRTVERQEPIISTKQNSILGVRQFGGQRVSQIQTPATIQSIMIPPVVPVTPSIPRGSFFTMPPVFNIPKQSFGFGNMFGFGRTKARGTKYQPSLTAMLFNIRGKPNKTSSAMGFTIRPIPILKSTRRKKK